MPQYSMVEISRIFNTDRYTADENDPATVQPCNWSHAYLEARFQSDNLPDALSAQPSPLLFTHLRCGGHGCVGSRGSARQAVAADSGNGGDIAGGRPWKRPAGRLGQTWRAPLPHWRAWLQCQILCPFRLMTLCTSGLFKRYKE